MDTTQDPANNSRSMIPDFDSQRKSLKDSLMKDIDDSRESVYREYNANNNSQHFNDQREQLRGRRRVENKPKKKRDHSDPGIRRSINQVMLNGGLFDGASPGIQVVTMLHCNMASKFRPASKFRKLYVA